MILAEVFFLDQLILTYIHIYNTTYITTEILPRPFKIRDRSNGFGTGSVRIENKHFLIVTSPIFVVGVFVFVFVFVFPIIIY